MNIFPQIPGFGAFNQPLPDALGIIAGNALDWVKTQVIQLGTSKQDITHVEPEASLTPEQVVQDQVVVEQVAAEASVVTANEALAINLASSHSSLLEQTVQAQVLPDTSGDEALAHALAQEEARPVDESKKEEKQQVSASFTSHTSKTQKRSKGHHHHHHHHRTHKK